MTDCFLYFKGIDPAAVQNKYPVLYFRVDENWRDIPTFDQFNIFCSYKTKMLPYLNQVIAVA